MLLISIFVELICHISVNRFCGNYSFLRLKYEDIETHQKLPNKGKKITDYFTSPSKKFKKEEPESASPSPNPSMASSSRNQTVEENPQSDFFGNYYSFNSLQRCQDELEPSVIVKVVSKPFKNELIFHVKSYSIQNSFAK